VARQPYFYLMRVVPTGEKSVKMEYEVYRNLSATNEEFEAMDAFFKQVEREDKFLCENVQKNLNADAYVAGPLHPHNEKGVLHFKSWLKRAVMKHQEQEKRSKHQISPMTRHMPNSNTTEEDVFCRSLCQHDSSEEQASLQW